MRYFKTPSLARWIWPGYTWKRNETEKIIYLTFDDGPIPEVTEFVLETLESFGAKATFFCVGDNIQKHPAIFQRLVEEGHQVGNHTFNHLNGVKHSDETYLQNVLKCQVSLEKALTRLAVNPSVKTLPLFRPPYGRLRSSQAGQLKKSYEIILWDVLTYDFDIKLDRETCNQKAIQHTEPGSIVV
ncbi:MAG: polysaccharide deacetylase family protein, partial [Bacteroidota bacterium]